jgi:hypothetical protein
MLSGDVSSAVRVPDDLVERLEVTEVRRSFGRTDHHDASLLALRYGTRLGGVSR